MSPPGKKIGSTVNESVDTAILPDSKTSTPRVVEPVQFVVAEVFEKEVGDEALGSAAAAAVVEENLVRHI